MATVSARSAWWLAIRPATLTASAAPVLVGTGAAWADGVFSAGPALAALLGAALLQVGANFANDVFDFERGADNADRLGPQRATQQGWISAAQMKRAMWLAFAGAGLVGIYLTAVAGWPVLAAGLLSIAAAYLYTGGPKPYGYLGLGDLSVFLFFGPVAVAGTYFVQGLSFSPLVFIAAIPIGTLATAILAVNNLRDIETDARAGKLTLAVRLGDGPTRGYYLLLLAIAYAAPPLLWWRGLAGPPVLLPWLTLPLVLRLASRMRHERGLALNGCLVQTARLEVVFGLLFALGLAW
ncbi:MAG TPA: 1,4-dihydroxy-2-naphthoate polyprenyltransferase [Steroidobacteraceae bacterium]|nr:1,4-dihydroxy-2-naphthoate polyprenyltransferase [Steroidobacteraceae bacterium]HQR48451.1 1,4-dihydroxy-2-naphthoate polyprenyltransferase [Steroidobacteraceae bacterium]